MDERFTAGQVVTSPLSVLTPSPKLLRLLRLVILYWMIECVAHSKTQELNRGYARTGIILFVSQWVVLIYEHEISPPLPPFFFWLPTARALSFV